MRIQNIQFTNQRIDFKKNNKSQITQQNTTTPIKEGIKTAGVWLGFGLGFDYVCRKFVVFKNSPIKNSLLVNSILAVLAGGFTAIKAGFKNK